MTGVQTCALPICLVLVGVHGSRSTSDLSSEDRQLRVPPPDTSRSLAVPAAHRSGAQPRGSVPGEPPQVPRNRLLGAADGEVAGSTTVFSDVPAVAKLDPALLAALRTAAADAAASGVELEVSSGWRSRRYQAELFREAVEKYGSEAEAERWVARPGTSVHEAGDAVDVGPSSAVTWLATHGDAFDLCQVYRNEPWHYELQPGATVRGCSTPYADPTHDPRMQS